MRLWLFSICCLLSVSTLAGCGPANKPASDDSADVLPEDDATPAADAADADDADGTAPSDDGQPTGDGAEEPVEKAPVPEPEASLDSEVKMLADKETQSEASDKLVAKGEAAVPLLIEALKSQNPQVRSGAVFTLSRLGQKAAPATAALKELQAAEKDEVIRDSISFALDAIDGE